MPAETLSAAAALRRLEAGADPGRARGAQRYFKTGRGEYGEGDVFLGLTAPRLRRLARECAGLPLDDVLELLGSHWHEARSLALLLLVDAYGRGDAASRGRIFDLYLRHRDRVDNWDLVDVSAPGIVGARLLELETAAAGDLTLLDSLAASDRLWDRRIAIVATLAFIRAGRFHATFHLAERLLGDRQDLVHKAVGWMLREVGKRDIAALEAFLLRHYRVMPRTMLRYAIERFPEDRRRQFLRGEA